MNITKLKNDTGITKSKIFSYKNISQNKEMFKSATGLEADDFQTVFEFLYPVFVMRISNFMMVKITKSLKVILRMLNLKTAKLLAIDQFFMYLQLLRSRFTTRIISWLFDSPKSTVSKYSVTWTNLLYFSFEKIVIWPSKVQVLDTVPRNISNNLPINLMHYLQKAIFTVIPECYVFQL